jgi:S-DNA-T family DNA segregation ATPase FtsK/SpoIIIE
MGLNSEVIFTEGLTDRLRLRYRINLPIWLWIFVYIFDALRRYKIISATIIIGIASFWTTTSFLTNIAVAFTAAAISLLLWIYFHYEHDPTPTRIIQAVRRRWLIKHRWPRALKRVGFNVIPPLRKIRYTPNGLTGKFKSDQGITSTDIANNHERIASILKAYEVKVNNSEPFRAYISIIWGDPTSRILYPEDIIQARPQNKESVTFGLDADHRPVNLSLTTSTLIIGESESGKSNCLWAVLNGMNEKQIHYRLWVADPAGGVELSELENSPFKEHYVQRFSDIELMISSMHEAMLTRLNALKEAGRRKNPNNEEYPLNVLVVDELLTLPNYDQRSDFGQILSAGRKAGFIVIALSQLSQIDALGRMRDLFPQRLCHATKNREMTDAALGTGAEQSGANCSRIPKSTPGVGYFFSLDSRVYTRFRTPLITDKATQTIAAGNKVQAPFRQTKRRSIIDRTTAVYQFYGDYDGEQGRLLYVGIAFDPASRQKEHAREKDWWRDVDTSLTEIDWYPTRKQAKQRESELIRSEFPVYNQAEAVPAGRFF